MLIGCICLNSTGDLCRKNGAFCLKTMKTLLLLFIASMKYLLFFCCLVVLGGLYGCANPQSTPVITPTAKNAHQQDLPRVCHQKTCWKVEIADDPEEQKQ